MGLELWGSLGFDLSKFKNTALYPAAWKILSKTFLFNVSRILCCNFFPYRFINTLPWNPQALATSDSLLATDSTTLWTPIEMQHHSSSTAVFRLKTVLGVGLHLLIAFSRCIHRFSTTLRSGLGLASQETIFVSLLPRLNNAGPLTRCITILQDCGYTTVFSVTNKR